MRSNFKDKSVLRLNVANIFLSLFLFNLGGVFFISADSYSLKTSLLLFCMLFVFSRAMQGSGFRSGFFIYIALVCGWLIFGIPAGVSNPRVEFIFYFLLDFFMAAMAYLVVTNKAHHRILENYLWFYTCSLAILCILDVVSVIDFRGALLGGASENYTTAFLIGFSLFFAGLQYKEDQKINYLTMVLIFVSSIYLESKFSAIISGAAIIFMFMVSSLNRFSGVRIVVRKCIFLLVVGMVLLFIFIFEGKFDLFSVLMSDPRVVIWSDFFSNAPPSAYLYGVKFDQCCAVVADFANNPHNSYIRAISFYGLGGHVFILILSLVFLHFIFSLRNYFYSGILLLWLGRALSDSILLPYPLDFFLFGLLSLIIHQFVIRGYGKSKIIYHPA